MLPLQAYHQPRSVAEAVALLAEHGERARVVAGATTLALSRSPLEVLVDLRRTGLDQIRAQEDGLHLGAMVTCRQLRAFLAKQPPSMLHDAAASLASKVLQNHITVGGNCVMTYAWSDLPVVLWCAQASFVLQGAVQRRLTADALWARHPTRVLQPGEILTEVIVPPAPSAGGSAYLKVARNANDQALVSVAAQLTLEEKRVSAARLVVGAVRGLPQVLVEAPANLIQHVPGPDLLEHVGQRAAAEIKLSEDYRASAAYRQQLVRTLTVDALERAVQRAGGGA